MELQELISLLEKPDELQKRIVAAKLTTLVALPDAQKQFDPKKHDIMDPTKRPDKVVTTDQGTGPISVARLPIPMQKRIVRLAATFLCGRPIELTVNAVSKQEKEMLELLKHVWKTNKLNYKSKRLAKLMMSEMECAELWYFEPAEQGYWKETPNDNQNIKYKARMRILAKSLGDDLYPVFNNTGDMIAFGRGYNIKVDGADMQLFDIYTAENIYYFSKGNNGWSPRMIKVYDGSEKAVIVNPVQKIPVIYYSQDYPEWYDVQELVDRLEKSISNHADTNDYHGSPTIKVKGKVKGFSKKGESGKILELEGEKADAEYMSWDKSPDSVKLEQENLLNLIYSLTDTPNISFEQMKGLGTFSGIALKMLFMGAHMKASDHEENFGESMQRRINYMLAALAIINPVYEEVSTLEVEPKFTYFLPSNEEEMISMLSTAVGSEKILSRKTAVSLNPFVEDAEAEMTNILAEEDASSAGAATTELNKPAPGMPPAKPPVNPPQKPAK
jgi:SPP1 family phage portal protein